MRRTVLILLLCGLSFCISAFPVVSRRAPLLWANQVGQHPVSVGLAGAAGLFFLCAVIGLVWRQAVPVKWWRGMVIMAAGLSLALCVSRFTAWTATGIVVDAVVLWGVVGKGWPANDRGVSASPVTATPVQRLMHVPVPWVFVLGYLAGVGIQFAMPLPVHSVSMLVTSRIAGFALMVCGIALAALCLGLFRAARTTTIPGESSRELVVSGPYHLSRNPMYVSLTLMYLGEAGVLAQGWPLVTLALVLVYLNRIVIPIEEARLREVFGAAYERYGARVRRWV